MVRKIKKIIDKYEYVSFDVFGTLIQRDISEKDMFELMAQENDITDFARKRVEAEQRAAKLNKYYSINDIYDELAKTYTKKVFDLIHNEETMQVAVAQASVVGKKLFQYVLDQNKKIIIISDMYLPKEIILKILFNCGYKEIPKSFVFVSCEERASKRDGSIFESILRKLEIPAEKILHIGDAWRSDCINPRIYGIRSIHFRENAYHVHYKGSKRGKKEAQSIILNRFIHNHECSKNENILFGYECLGPVLYGFARWLQEKNVERYDTILFLAREGRIFLDAYQIVGENSKAQYLLVSRKSLIQTLLWKRTLSEKIEMLPLPDYFKVDVLADYLGIDFSSQIKEESNERIKKSDLKKNQALWNELQEKEKLINKFSREQYQLLVELLPQNINSVALVDIGWKGTMQHFLSEIINDIKYTKVHGFYLGVSNEGIKCFPKEKKSGYLFEGNGKCENRYSENMIFSFSGLLEATLTAQHGSVHSYYEENGVKAKLYTQNNGNCIVDEIQKGAIQFVKDIVDSAIMRNVDIKPTVAADKLYRIGNYPRKKELEYASNIAFFDAENSKLVEKVAFEEMKKNMKIYFRNSKWKVGFIKINFPFIPFLPQLYSFFRGKKK